MTSGEFRILAPGSPGAMGWAGKEAQLADTGLGTQCVHGGAAPDPAYGAVAAPIYETSTFALLDVRTSAGFEYTRTGNPTRARLEAALALLEGGCGAICTSSGMSGIIAVLSLLPHGSHVLCPDDCYGGTFRALRHAQAVHGLETTFLDMTDPEAVAAAVRPETRLIWAETPSNPLLRLLDLAALARVARDRDLLLAVDNTFLSPVNQRPLHWGADLVFHSTTKYLNGHSDVVGGTVVAARGRDDLLSRLAALNNTLGTSQSPHDCALVLRGLKTLHLRMRAHEANARALAGYLAAHPAVARVNYPGLPGHPQHTLALRQQEGFGAMLSFELKDGSADSVRRFLRRLRWFTLAESLGGVESLVSQPASMSHAAMTPDMRERIGIRDGLIRLSVGVEEQADLVEDLRQALEG